MVGHERLVCTRLVSCGGGASSQRVATAAAHQLHALLYTAAVVCLSPLLFSPRYINATTVLSQLSGVVIHSVDANQVLLRVSLQPPRELRPTSPAPPTTAARVRVRSTRPSVSV